MKELATINDVALYAGVSKKTVSRVMNNELNVRPQTRDKVQAAMRALNYFPNLSARSLASKRSYLVCLLYRDVGPYVFQQIQAHLLEAFAARNYSLILQPCTEDLNQALHMVEHKARYMNVDGFVLMPPLVDLKPVTELLKQLEKPYIRITPSDDHDGFSEILCDDEQAAFELTTYLLGQGHKNIGFIMGSAQCLSTKMRFQGYKRALLTAGRTIDTKFIAEGDYSFESGILAAKTLLSLASAPTAIFCSNDDMAAGVLHWAHEFGLSIPYDLVVVGYDDSPLAAQTWPALTSVKLPSKEMAEVTANKLLDRIAGVAEGDYPQNFPCQVVYRASTFVGNQTVNCDALVPEV